MKETFIRCTDALLACLSEYDLDTLQAIYRSRLVSAKQQMNQQSLSEKHDDLAQAQYLFQSICDALAVEQARRSRPHHNLWDRYLSQSLD